MNSGFNSREKPHERANSLQQLLDERWSEYLQACARHHPSDEQHAMHLRFYAAMRKLSEAVGDGKVSEAILEIGANLIGCEQMAILAVHLDARDEPRLGSVGSSEKEVNSTTRITIRSAGLTQEKIEGLRSNAQRIVDEVSEGEIYVKDSAAVRHPLLSSLAATALVPLWHNKRSKGAIVLFGLLPQRDGLDAADRALLKLLAVYAGPCLFNC